MPRLSRVKNECAIYHIMVRSISEVDLFREDEDKIQYLNIINQYKKTYLFKVYAYCLMSNHGHLIIDSNGTDISKVMHCINFKYARYFNEKYKRHGHLFQDRFKSKIVENERYLYALTIYIHNNPTDIYGYRYNPEKYEFSSLKSYITNKKDRFKILDKNFINLMFNRDDKVAKNIYMRAVLRCDIENEKQLDGEFDNEGTKYDSKRHIIKRNFSIKQAVNFICKRMNVTSESIYIKNSRGVVNVKAILVVFMRVFCNIGCEDICKVLGNITQSRVSALFNIGSNLIIKSKMYGNILNDFLNLESKKLA